MLGTFEAGLFPGGKIQLLHDVRLGHVFYFPVNYYLSWCESCTHANVRIIGTELQASIIL
jgi:hypothetical protein